MARVRWQGGNGGCPRAKCGGLRASSRQLQGSFIALNEPHNFGGLTVHQDNERPSDDLLRRSGKLRCPERRESHDNQNELSHMSSKIPTKGYKNITNRNALCTMTISFAGLRLSNGAI